MDTEKARTDPSDLSHSSGADRRRRNIDLATLGDDELAGAAAVGDTEAFGILVTRLTPGLLRYLRRMVADRQIVEDLAQETLLDAWKGLSDFAFRSSFRTWVFSIAHRKVVDHFRRRRDIPTEAESFADLTSPEPLPADQVITTSLADALQRELADMPQTPRAVWWLREAEGLSVAEISRIMQISHGSTRGHLQRSRRYLATRLSPWRPPDSDITAAPVLRREKGARE